ncbi:hypothetical protein DL96DRAFT_1623746 [Flagelloscypha sp. PMI_526]|nr:hypothetical protein DL96DRAFT_1623746 [Flagelloscypha sp. PMI_526]
MFFSDGSSGSSAGADALSTNVVMVFDILLLLGFLVSTASLLTAGLSKRIVRSSQWFIFMGFASFWSIQHLLLVGNQLTPTIPPHAICLVQSSFGYAAPPATAFALLALFLQIFLLLEECLEGTHRMECLYSPTFLWLPFAIYASVFVMALSMGLVQPERVVRDELRITCRLDGGTMLFVEAGLVTFACIVIMVMEGFIIVKIWKNYHRIRLFNSTSREKHFPLSLAIRALIFSLLPILTIIMSIVSMARSFRDEDPSTPEVNIIIASLPLSAGLLFGTQRDILSTWTFWRRGSPACTFDSMEKLPNGQV